MCGEQARYALCQLLIVITMQARTQVQHCNEVSMYSVQHNHKLWAFLSHLWSEVFLQIDVMYCTSKMQYTDVGASSEDRTQDLQLTSRRTTTVLNRRCICDVSADFGILFSDFS